MIADLKPYAEYKESGSRWMGRIPTSWNVRHLRTVISRRNERNRPDLPLLSVAREKGVFVRSMTDSGENHNVIPEDLSNYKVARAGNLVINKMKAWQGSMGIAPCDGIVSPAYYVFDLGIENRMFAQRLLRSRDYIAHFACASDGVRVGQWDLSIAGMRNIPVLLPDASEQMSIVRFLDWADGQLEQTIRAKRKAISLFNEQKEGIIQTIVTRGVDQPPRFRDSKVLWIGAIPAHWQVRRLKTMCHFVTSGSRGWARYYSDSGSIFLRIGNISTSSIDLRLRKISYVNAPKDAEGARTRVVPDDLLLSITAQMGAVGIAPVGLGEAFVNQHIALIRLRSGAVVPKWVAYCLLSRFGKDQCQLLTNGGTKVGLTLDDVRCLSVLLPPLDEQLFLVREIERRTHDLDDAVRRLEREIELLREYRTRLVADVVTGKVDVREAAARLPEARSIDTVEEEPDTDIDLEAADEELAV